MSLLLLLVAATATAASQHLHAARDIDHWPAKLDLDQVEGALIGSIAIASNRLRSKVKALLPFNSSQRLTPVRSEPAV
jgi:hypothetical protein